jgi:hypothetical protein
VTNALAGIAEEPLIAAEASRKHAEGNIWTDCRTFVGKLAGSGRHQNLMNSDKDLVRRISEQTPKSLNGRDQMTAHNQCVRRSGVPRNSGIKIQVFASFVNGHSETPQKFGPKQIKRLAIISEWQGAA